MRCHCDDHFDLEELVNKPFDCFPIRDIMALATRIQVLFVDKDVSKVESIFCSHMVRFLSEPRTLFYNNEVRVLGGCERHRE